MPSTRQAREIVKGCRREKSRPATTDVPMISTSRRTVEITQQYVDGEKIRYRDGWAAVGLWEVSRGASGPDTWHPGAIQNLHGCREDGPGGRAVGNELGEMQEILGVSRVSVWDSGQPVVPPCQRRVRISSHSTACHQRVSQQRRLVWPVETTGSRCGHPGYRHWTPDWPSGPATSGWPGPVTVPYLFAH